MSLQQILLKLSNNKKISITTYSNAGTLYITIKEEYTFREMLKIDYDLNRPSKDQEEVVNKLKSYF
jgi:hypothetical protein